VENTATITIYDTRRYPVQVETIDLDTYWANIRRAIYRYWYEQHFDATAVLIPLQVAQHLNTQLLEVPGVRGLFYVGDIDGTPILARTSYLDPLFMVI